MKNLFFLFVIICVISACNLELEEVIDWKLDSYPDMLVVEGVITNEYKQQTIHLTLTSQYFDTLPPRPVTGANIQVFVMEENYPFTESETQPGWYLSDVEFSGQPLGEYIMKINLNQPVNGLTDYSASSTMPMGLIIDSALFYIYEMPEVDFYGDEEERDSTILGVYFYGLESSNYSNYYVNKVYRNHIPLQANAKEYSIYKNEFHDGEYLHFDAYIKNIAANDSITFEEFSVEKGFYDYLEAIKNADLTGGMGSMSGPPANAVGNISDGKGLGYFVAAYKSEITGIAVDMRK